jgi:hypothetical protein
MTKTHLYNSSGQLVNLVTGPVKFNSRKSVRARHDTWSFTDVKDYRYATSTESFALSNLKGSGSYYCPDRKQNGYVSKEMHLPVRREIDINPTTRIVELQNSNQDSNNRRRRRTVCGIIGRVARALFVLEPDIHNGACNGLIS